jgi:type IV secretory pathway TraG/TraD family ATPase VirD4
LEAIVGAYGPHHPLLEACKVQVIFGLNDGKVAELFSKRVGITEVVKTRTMGGGKTSRETVKEALLSATALMGLSDRQALVLAGRHKVLAQKVHYQERTWLHGG